MLNTLFNMVLNAILYEKKVPTICLELSFLYKLFFCSLCVSFFIFFYKERLFFVNTLLSNAFAKTDKVSFIVSIFRLPTHETVFP